MIRTTIIPLSCTLLLALSACDSNDDATPTDPRGDDVMPCVTDCPDIESAGDDRGDDDGDHEDTDCSDTDDDDDTDTDTDDEDTDTDDDEDEADLPYAIEVDVGDTVDLDDAFLEKGPLPAAVLEVTMDGGDWRLNELQNGIPFVVDEADCDHEGNRDTGRDRIFVTWQNDDGSEDTDHIDLRYCGA